jgi:Phage Terminase
MSTSPLPIDKALTDPRLLGAALGDVGTWATWLAVLKAAFVLPLSDSEHELFAAVAGARALPKKRVREIWTIAGRRSGKSRMAAALAVFFALFVVHKLAAGERGMVLVLAQTVEQAKVVFEYVLGFLRASDVLRNEVAAVTRNEVRLRNGIVIATHANSFRSLRGRTLAAVILDEVAYFRDDTTATPDTEVYTAVLPSLATTNGMLVGISSPYRKVGLLHAKHKQYFGIDSDDVLVVQGPTVAFNKTLDEAAIAAQRQADPTAARSEWDAEVRADLVSFLDDQLVDAAIDGARPLELPPRPNLYYRAFVDASGGAVGGDAYALAIAHREDGRYIVDVVRGQRGPFDPVELTKEYAGLCKQYRVTSVTGDKYALEWVISAWRNAGIAYERSELTASELYLEALPLFTRALVALPPHPTLERELRLLERSPARLKREQVTHPRGCHDDHANVVCGVLCGLASYLGAGAYAEALARAVDGDDVPDSVLSWQEQERRRRHDELMQRYGQPGRFDDDADAEDKRASDERYRRELGAHIYACTGIWPR